MPKCDFSLKSHFGMVFPPVNVLHIFKTCFPKNAFEVMLLCNKLRWKYFYPVSCQFFYFLYFNIFQSSSNRFGDDT